jgi:diadenylate cyclase
MNDLALFRALRFEWRDVVEIAVSAFLFYRILLLIRGTRAVQMLTGIVVLAVVYAVAFLLKLSMITYLLGIVFTYGAFALLVIFQPELRAGLAHLGQSHVTRFFKRSADGNVEDEIADAVERLARSGIGGIIALEREMPLDDYVESGSSMQAKLSADLITTIFTPYSPLHDGAVLVRGDSIIGAGCILPLSQSIVADRNLGTRHRAALGLSEDTDAVIVVVSEERSTISIAQHGVLQQNLTAVQVRDLLAGRIPRTTAEHPLLTLRT